MTFAIHCYKMGLGVYSLAVVLLQAAIWTGCAAERECHKCYGICCPRPGDPDDHTICTRNNGTPGCMSKIAFAGIFIGVFGGLFVIGLIIGIVLCIYFKKKKYSCVKVSPGRYRLMSPQNAERFRVRQDAIDSMVAQYAAGAAASALATQPNKAYVMQYGPAPTAPQNQPAQYGAWPGASTGQQNLSHSTDYDRNSVTQPPPPYSF